MNRPKQFIIDGSTHPGVLFIEIVGSPDASTMAEMVTAHERAIRNFRGAPYRVFCDLRKMLPLGPDAAAHFATAKAFSARQANFQGSAVLVASATIAMQHRRTSAETGVLPTELISHDEDACWHHLQSVERQP